LLRPGRVGPTCPPVYDWRWSVQIEHVDRVDISTGFRIVIDLALCQCTGFPAQETRSFCSNVKIACCRAWLVGLNIVTLPDSDFLHSVFKVHTLAPSVHRRLVHSAVMNRIFGTSASKKPKPSLQDAINSVCSIKIPFAAFVNTFNRPMRG